MTKHMLCYCHQLTSTCDFCSGIRTGTIDDYKSKINHLILSLKTLDKMIGDLPLPSVKNVIKNAIGE